MSVDQSVRKRCALGDGGGRNRQIVALQGAARVGS